MGGSVPLIVEVHAEDAAILWLQRDRAVDAPHFDRMRLARLDERLEANLDGLRVAGRLGWETARAAFDRHSEPGEMFTLAALAFGAGSARGIGEVLDLLEGDEGLLTRAAISGLGWLDRTALRGRVQPLLDDPRPQVRALGLGACAVHQVDPGSQLQHFLADRAPVRRQALKLAGLMGRQDLRLEGDSDAACAFWADWARVRLGDRGRPLEAFWALAAKEGPFQFRAFELAVIATDPATARARVRDTGAFARPLALRAAGRIGDCEMIPWLISMMEGPSARIAGESFSMITGADLTFLDLDGPAPEEDGPGDDPADPRVELDEDMELPVPDRARVEAWWRDRQGRFQTGQRYFLGEPVSAAVYDRAFHTAFQRQRRVAALASACLSPAQPVANWRARQRRIRQPRHEPGYWQVIDAEKGG